MRGLVFYTTLICEFIIPTNLFAWSVIFDLPTFTLAALLLFPIFIMVEYMASLALADGKNSNFSPVPFETPPLYPIAHQIGVIVFLLAFGRSLSSLQQVLLVVSYFIGYLGVLVVGKYAIAKVNWQMFGRLTPTHETLTFFSLALSVGALIPIYVALHAKLPSVAMALLIALLLGMPHPPFSPKGEK